MTSAALIVFAVAVSSIHEISAFGNNPLSTTVCRAMTRQSSALSESFGNGDDEQPKKKGFFQNFFDEMDAFVDDATSRRLGNGAQYYGKRKSSFYGKDDINKKRETRKGKEGVVA